MEIDEFQTLSGRILRATCGVIVGDGIVVQKMLCAALAGGHVLFEDNPGLGKTLLAKVFARVSGCEWGRVQFTPDMMPGDILGARIWKDARTGFVLEKARCSRISCWRTRSTVRPQRHSRLYSKPWKSGR